MSQEEKFISLSDIVSSITESIKPIIIITLLILSVTFYLAINDKDRWVVKVNIFELNEMQFSEFAPFNSEKSIFKINKSYLSSLFYDELKDLDEVRKAIIELDLINIQNFDTEKDFIDAVATKAHNLSVNIGTVDEIASIDVQFKSENLNEAKKLLELVLFNTNKNVQKYLIDNFENTIANYQESLAHQIEDIDKQIKSSKDLYKLQIEADIAFLQEQAEIARSLGISENALQTEFMKTELLISQGSSEENEIAQIYPFSNSQNHLSRPYYLRGHISIEKEISLKEKRSNINLFIPDIIKLINMKDNIIQDTTIERLRKIYDKSPIAKENFHSVNYDLAGITHDKVDRSNFLFLGIYLLSILFVSFIIFLINLTKNYLRNS